HATRSSRAQRLLAAAAILAIGLLSVVSVRLVAASAPDTPLALADPPTHAPARHAARAARAAAAAAAAVEPTADPTPDTEPTPAVAPTPATRRHGYSYSYSTDADERDRFSYGYASGD